VNKLFRVEPDEEQYPNSDVIASHHWTLPGVFCPYCDDSWGSTLAYPTIEMPDLKPTAKARSRSPIPLKEFRDLVERHPKLKELFILPGTQFGELVGKVIGTPGDFAWVHSWYLLIKKERLNELVGRGFKSPDVSEPDLLFQRKTEALLEFEIRPLASWDIKKLKKSYKCEHCGFFRDGLRDEAFPSVLGASIPTHVDLFSIKQAPAIILCREPFVRLVKELGLTNITFRKIRVS
jgi:uncharacterized double-CXXCG motif protein